MENQYSLFKIISIWAIVTLPMGILAWVVTPLIVSAAEINPGIVFWLMMIVGMVWQFLVSMYLIKKETGEISLSSIKKRLRLNKPINPVTKVQSSKLFLWVIPFILLRMTFLMLPLPDVMTNLFPFINDLPKYNVGDLATPEYAGAFWILGLYLISSLFNYLFGEEFLFRGILLPKMNGVFGKYDWIANGVLFGFYHIHKPQIMFWAAVFTGLIFSYPSKKFNTTFMSVIIHGAEGVFILFLVLGIVFGLT